MKVTITLDDNDTIMLSQIQKRFCEEYALSNKTIEAYLKVSPKSTRVVARQRGYEIKKSEAGRKYIQYLENKQYNATKNELEDKKKKISIMLEKMIDSDISDLYDDNGEVKHPDEMPEGLKNLLNIKHGGKKEKQQVLWGLQADTEIQYNASAKIKAIERLAQMYGLMSSNDIDSVQKPNISVVSPETLDNTKDFFIENDDNS